jgi:acetylornithine deacetylase/succinyl-diaminopimelate desuccinylase-like protein
MARARELAAQTALANGCTVEVRHRSLSEPASMAEPVREIIEDAIVELGVPVFRLPSGAGHDAAILAGAGVPVGMLFVRSLEHGISHSPEEDTDPEAVALTIAALTHAVRRLGAWVAIGSRGR